MTGMHPPIDKRCQIYSHGPLRVARCANTGSHWEKWSGCNCSVHDDEMCVDDFYSWECDGPCTVGETAQ